MNIFITYDYELFFGTPTGSVEKCILQPTEDIIKLGDETGAKFTFFIDAGYLKQLDVFRKKFPQLEKDYLAVVEQIKTLLTKGHACELHIHPHWENSYYSGKEWVMNTDQYKLSDFKENEAIAIVKEYAKVLSNITGLRPNTFRAGGWCLQPFQPLKNVFSEIGIEIDSTVFRYGYFDKGNYYYDFRNIPDKEFWTFSSKITEEDPSGDFCEFPIESHQYSPIFFWKLFILGRLNKSMHKPIGDGYPMPSLGMRKEMLTKGKLLSASVDGYFVSKLQSILTRKEKLGHQNYVIIGHPKANTKFALNELKKFIKKNQNKHNFVPLNQAKLINALS